jgi:hypothetical protein
MTLVINKIRAILPKIRAVIPVIILANTIMQ